MKGLLAGLVVSSTIFAECSAATLGHFPNQLGGVTLGMSKAELTGKLGAREVVGAPGGAAESAGIGTPKKSESRFVERWQKFEIMHGTGPRVLARVDVNTQRVDSIEIELPPQEFVPIVLAYSAEIGHPRSTVDVYSYAATWLSKDQSNYFMAELKIGMGKPSGWLKVRMADGTIPAVSRTAVYEKTRVLLSRVEPIQ